MAVVDDRDALVEAPVVDRHDVSGAARENVTHTLALQRAGDDPTSVHHGDDPLPGNWRTKGTSVAGGAMEKQGGRHSRSDRCLCPMAPRARVTQREVVPPSRAVAASRIALHA